MQFNTSTPAWAARTSRPHNGEQQHTVLTAAEHTAGAANTAAVAYTAPVTHEE